MNEAVKERWIEALLSGDYEQGKILLKDMDGDDTLRYCCLGVLCELAVAAGVVQGSEEGRRGGYYHFGGMASGLPPSVQKWSGVNSTYGEIPGGNGDLAVMNDNGWSFTEIAEVIREKF